MRVSGFIYPDNLESIINYARQYLQDNPKLNTLVQGLEFDDTLLQTALESALTDFNAIEPSTNLSYMEIPLSLIGRLTALKAMEIAGIYHIRNHFPVSDGTVTVDIHQRGSEYVSLIQGLYQNLYQSILSFKSRYWSEEMWDYIPGL